MNEELPFMTTKLCGVVFRKALIDGNWSKVYENFIFSLMEEDIEDEADLLRSFGNIGG